jgi:hypothetical protein
MWYTIRPLDTSTWAAFAELAARNNGVYGGCWCMAYHPEVSRTDGPVGLSIRQSAAHQCRSSASAGCRRLRSSTYPGDGRARAAPPSVHNDHFRVPSAGPAGSAPAAHSGGYARVLPELIGPPLGGIKDARN